MTKRFPQQRNRSAQRRADANQVPAVIENAEFDDASSDDERFGDAAFDESFVAAAAVHELSAEDRARQPRKPQLPDQRTGDEPIPMPTPRWSVRPSHHLAAVRPLPAIAAVVCILAVTTLLIMMLR